MLRLKAARIWVSSSRLVATILPSRLERNLYPPPFLVIIRSITILGL
jgi:hypothetical protein